MVSRRRRAQDDDLAGSENPNGRCPHCGEDAVAWDVTQPTPGAQAEFNAMPICLSCGRPIDLSPPEQPAGACVTCGQDVVWELRDPRDGFIATCPRHGTTEVYQPPQPERESHAV